MSLVATNHVRPIASNIGLRLSHAVPAFGQNLRTDIIRKYKPHANEIYTQFNRWYLQIHLKLILRAIDVRVTVAPS